VLGRSLAGEDPTFFVDDVTTSLRQPAAVGPSSDSFSESEAIALSSHHLPDCVAAHHVARVRPGQLLLWRGHSRSRMRP